MVDKGKETDIIYLNAKYWALSCSTPLDMDSKEESLSGDTELVGWSLKRVAVNGSLSKQRRVVMGLAQFSIFLSDTDSGIKCTQPVC